MGSSKIRKGVIIFIFAGIAQLYGCHKTSWKDARQAGTYKAYQAYVKDHPRGKHAGEARARADSLYWQSIKSDTTAKAFQTYLDQFPKGSFRSQAQAKVNHPGKPAATKARVTGSGVIIRADHTTASSSKGVVAKKGTEVQILDRYSSGNTNGAILKRSVRVDVHGQRIRLAEGKAIHILADRQDSVSASFSTRQFGPAKAMIGKADIEAMSGQSWYKIRTSDGITGWIYGKFIEEL